MKEWVHSILLFVMIIVIAGATFTLVKYGKEVKAGPCNVCEVRMHAKCIPDYMYSSLIGDKERWNLDTQNGALPIDSINIS